MAVRFLHIYLAKADNPIKASNPHIHQPQELHLEFPSQIKAPLVREITESSTFFILQSTHGSKNQKKILLLAWNVSMSMGFNTKPTNNFSLTHYNMPYLEKLKSHSAAYAKVAPVLYNVPSLLSLSPPIKHISAPTLSGGNLTIGKVNLSESPRYVWLLMAFSSCVNSLYRT